MITSAVTAEEIRKRAERGAARLDQHDPNWALLVDPNTTVIMYVDECVLGQYFVSYDDGLEKLQLTSDPENDRYTVDHDVVQLGFDLAHAEACDDGGRLTDAGREAYRRLTDAWRSLIGERRRRGVIPVERPIP